MVPRKRTDSIDVAEFSVLPDKISRIKNSIVESFPCIHTHTHWEKEI